MTSVALRDWQEHLTCAMRPTTLDLHQSTVQAYARMERPGVIVLDTTHRCFGHT